MFTKYNMGLIRDFFLSLFNAVDGRVPVLVYPLSRKRRKKQDNSHSSLQDGRLNYEEESSVKKRIPENH